MQKWKKSQISPFIIIAVIIISIIISYFLFNSDISKRDASINPELQPVYNYVDNCLKEVGEEGIYYIGGSGGYLEIPEISLENNIAYYLYDDDYYMPSKEKIEEQISLYMESFLPFCINEFEELPDFKITEKPFEIKTEIEDEKVVFNVDYKLSVKKGENSFLIENFRTEIPVRLGIIYKAISEFMEEQMKRTDSICVSCLYEITEKYQLHFHALDTNETYTLLFAVRDENSKILGEDYVFYFVNKLSKLE